MVTAHFACCLSAGPLPATEVDLIVSNQAHPGWQAAFEGSGFLLLPDRRLLAMSPGLSEALAPIDETRQGLHLTNLDGHGPRGL